MLTRRIIPCLVIDRGRVTKGTGFVNQRDAMSQGEAAAVLAASIFHSGEYSIAEAKAFLDQRDVRVRPFEAQS